MKVKTFLDQLEDVVCKRREALHQPEDEVKQGEELLGVLEEERARALYSFWKELTNSLNKMTPDAPPSSAEEMQRFMALLPKIIRAKGWAELAGELFWESVKENFEKSRGEEYTVGIRIGWQVVVFPSPQARIISALGDLGFFQ